MNLAYFLIQVQNKKKVFQMQEILLHMHVMFWSNKGDINFDSFEIGSLLEFLSIFSL